jgi:hypothetical protein
MMTYEGGSIIRKTVHEIVARQSSAVADYVGDGGVFSAHWIHKLEGWEYRVYFRVPI